MPPELGRALLAQSQLQNLIKSTAAKSESDLRQALKSDKPADRFAAAIVVGDKGLPMGVELTELLIDKDPLVRQAARQSLIVLSYYVDAAKKAKLKNAKPKAVDFGPKPTANVYALKDSAKKWKDWLGRNDADLKALPPLSELGGPTTSMK